MVGRGWAVGLFHVSSIPGPPRLREHLRPAFLEADGKFLQEFVKLWLGADIWPLLTFHWPKQGILKPLCVVLRAVKSSSTLVLYVSAQKEFSEKQSW